MEGIYLLRVDLNDDKEIEVGALGKIGFKEGIYVYVGSAQSGIKTRVGRHLKEEKKKHWHIDYLLDHAEVSKVYLLEGEKKDECATAGYMDKIAESIPEFGSSDCNCDSHLFRYGVDDKGLHERIEGIPKVEELDLKSLRSSFE